MFPVVFHCFVLSRNLHLRCVWLVMCAQAFVRANVWFYSLIKYLFQRLRSCACEYYICMHVCVIVYVYVRISVSACVYVYKYWSIYWFVYVSIYIYSYKWMYICACVYTYIQFSLFLSRFLHTYMFIYRYKVNFRLSQKIGSKTDCDKWISEKYGHHSGGAMAQ